MLTASSVRISFIFSLKIILFFYWVFFVGEWYLIRAAQNTEDQYGSLRERMVEVQLKNRDIKNERVLEVMKVVPRHLFMPSEVRAYAYKDLSLIHI